MPVNLDPFKKWFGYSRSERKASFTLLVIIFLILAARMAVPAKNLEVHDITKNVTFVTIDDDDPVQKGQVKNKQQRVINPQKVIRKRIELNSCDSAMLESLPGLGPVLSSRIIRFRNLLGGFVSVSQLKEVYGLPPETYEMINERFYIDSSLIRKVKINTAGYSELSRFPYLKNYEIASIIKYRKVAGRIRTAGELVENKILSDSSAMRVAPYLDFE